MRFGAVVLGSSPVLRTLVLCVTAEVVDDVCGDRAPTEPARRER